MKKLQCSFLVMLMANVALAAPEGDKNEPVQNADVEVQQDSVFFSSNLPQVERTINLSTARTTRPGALLMIIDHRTNKPMLDSGLQDYFGLDSGGLKIGLGLRYGIIDGLDAGFYRLNGTAETFDTYQVDARWQFLNQDSVWINMAVRLGASWFVQPGQDAAGMFGQLLIDRVIFDRLCLSAGLLFHSESSNDVKAITDDSWSTAVSVGAEVRILSWMALDLETSINIAGYGSKYPVFSLGLKILTYRHTFSLVFSNNQYIDEDGMVTNTWREFGDMIVGFQITREFNL